MSDSAASVRVAVIGAGPAGFYLVERLLGRPGVTVDLYERLPAPYGLVRYGVAPDHEKIRNVTRVFDKIAARPGFRFFGNVRVGEDVTLADLRRHYHQIAFAIGAQTDRHMNVPGEDLPGNHTATEFVAWYNGHPDYHGRTFDLSAERVAVVGVGNVAVDVARILCRTPDELAATDIADHALEALRGSRVREVVMLGRRGPAQAAFTTPEVKELGDLPGADVRVRPDEVALDSASRAAIARESEPSLTRKIEVLEEFADRAPSRKPRILTLRFLVSPLRIEGEGRVDRLVIARNRLEPGPDGRLRAVATGETETLDVGLVFRSVGYRGLPIPGLPFDERHGTVPNAAGRVRDPDTGRSVPGLYVTGWIKRGPSGVIGTNKPDAAETAASMVADLDAAAVPEPAEPDSDAALATARAAQPRLVDYPAWLRLQALEVARGREAGRPRVKYCTVADMLQALEGEGVAR